MNRLLRAGGVDTGRVGRAYHDRLEQGLLLLIIVIRLNVFIKHALSSDLADKILGVILVMTSASGGQPSLLDI
jgi:hypothetical protein